MEGKKAHGPAVKKPFYKKWWFWLIIVTMWWFRLNIVILVFGAIGNLAGNEAQEVPAETKESVISAEETEESDEETGGIDFVVNEVRNDVTGNWRIALIAENIDIKDIALDYYNNYFESDDEIHAIVNFTTKTTTKISSFGDLLDVTVHEYVEDEEHSAKQLFGGEVLKEYLIDKESGEITRIQ